MVCVELGLTDGIAYQLRRRPRVEHCGRSRVIEIAVVFAPRLLESCLMQYRGASLPGRGLVFASASAALRPLISECVALSRFCAL